MRMSDRRNMGVGVVVLASVAHGQSSRDAGLHTLHAARSQHRNAARDFRTPHYPLLPGIPLRPLRVPPRRRPAWQRPCCPTLCFATPHSPSRCSGTLVNTRQRPCSLSLLFATRSMGIWLSARCRTATPRCPSSCFGTPVPSHTYTATPAATPHSPHLCAGSTATPGMHMRACITTALPRTRTRTRLPTTPTTTHASPIARHLMPPPCPTAALLHRHLHPLHTHSPHLWHCQRHRFPMILGRGTHRNPTVTRHPQPIMPIPRTLPFPIHPHPATPTTPLHTTLTATPTATPHTTTPHMPPPVHRLPTYAFPHPSPHPRGVS